MTILYILAGIGWTQKELEPEPFEYYIDKNQ